MPDQEFLASFAVEIDLSGVQRLQQVLEQNRDLADALAEAFRNAKAELDAFFGELSGLPLPTGFSAFSRVSEEAAGLSFPVSLDFSKANKEMAAFVKSATKALTLRADASGVVSAGTAALNQLRSLFASTKLPLQVEIQESGSPPYSGSGSSDPSSGGKTPTQKTIPEPSGGEDPFHPVILQAATGGRFDKPTYTEIAEDGDPEYVIPVKKEPLAVPLLSQLVSELSDSARETLRAAMGEPSIEKQPVPAHAAPLFAPEQGDGFARYAQRNYRTVPDVPAFNDDLLNALQDLPEMLASAVPAAAPNISQVNNQNVSAPVSINVTAAGSDPEAVGRSLYDVTERYLLRTMQSAL